MISLLCGFEEKKANEQRETLSLSLSLSLSQTHTHTHTHTQISRDRVLEKTDGYPWGGSVA